MSADNYIYIDPKTFDIWHCTASCCGGKIKNGELVVTKKDLEKQKMSYIGKGKNMEEAMKRVEEWEHAMELDGAYLEYGTFTYLWCK